MKPSPWQRRITRAEHLAKEHPFASEILGFYARIALFQEDLYHRLGPESERLNETTRNFFGPPELPALINSFNPFLSVVEEHGPARLAAIARELQGSSPESCSKLLDASWNATEGAESPEEFLTLAFLQPYAEFVRQRLATTFEGYNQPLCPFCGRKAGLGVLRPQGDGARRSLVCSFCLAEWEFRRILCPGCGEENNAKLPLYTASDFDYVRVDGCDTCKTYIKSVDLSKNGLAEPIVDEMAAAPLDIWAQKRGYSKLQLNLMGL